MVQRSIRLAALAVLIFGLSLLAQAQADPTVNDLLEKNLRAAGGKDRIASIMNFSFRTGDKTYFMASDGRMKITAGDPPVITEVILVDGSGSRRNCFNRMSGSAPILDATYQTLALLRSGMFSLWRFRDGLVYKGEKKYGPEARHLLAAEVGRLQVEFELGSSEFTLQRMVLKGFDPGQGTYEISHDFGPFEEIQGIRIPSSWFSSQVGGRGLLYEITDVRFNLPLEEDFFSRMEVNVGPVHIESGILEGTIVAIDLQNRLLTLGTNWTPDCITAAGLANQDALELEVKGRTIPVLFYAGPPPRGALKPGSGIMIPNRTDENFVVILVLPEAEQLAEELDRLMPIRLKKR